METEGDFNDASPSVQYEPEEEAMTVDNVSGVAEGNTGVYLHLVETLPSRFSWCRKVGVPRTFPQQI